MISLQRGGLICGDCVEFEEPVVSITPGALALLRQLDSTPLSELARFPIDNRTGKMVAEVILSLAIYHLGLPRNLRSFKFLDDLTK